MSTQVPTQRSQPTAQGATGVQSLHRALDVLEAVSVSGGALSIGELAAATGLPAPTAHRLARTLVERGYLRQLPDRRYALGFRLVPLGATAQLQVGADAGEVLAGLVAEIGESANLAVLTGHQAEYVAQAPARYSMRMFTEVGRRVDLHCTGVGKAMLAQLDDEAVAAVVRRAGLTRVTEHTITTEAGLREALATVRREGHALDEQEQELGVRCVAVPVGTPPTWMAVSVSGPVPRMTDEVVRRALPLLHAAAERLAATLETPPAPPDPIHQTT